MNELESLNLFIMSGNPMNIELERRRDKLLSSKRNNTKVGDKE